MGIPGPGERNSICHEGCAMSCVAMALAGYGFTFPGNGTITPGSLNNWLKTNRGYTCISGDCNNLVLDAPDNMTAGHMRLVGEWGGPCCGGDAAKPPLKTIQEHLSPDSDRHMVFIAHVRNNSHFVLLTSFDNNTNSFTVHDPGFNQTYYNYMDISDILMYSILPPKSYVPKYYPLQKQYDYRWGDDVIVTKTIRQVGCLMSSTSMALLAHGVKIDDGTQFVDSTPGTFNYWLRNHHGYDDSDDLKENIVPQVDEKHVQWPSDAMHTVNDITFEQVQTMLAAGRPIIANVMKGRHFVLVVGTDPSSSSLLYVNDPGFYRITYSIDIDVVGWRLFNMTDVKKI